MTDRSVTHSTWTLERTYEAAPGRVFKAFADKDAKSKWFGGGEALQWDFDFRVGGREVNVGRMDGGSTFALEALYQDIVPDERIVYTYEMRMDDQRISVSLATVQLEAAGGGTRLTYTEQGAYLDGLDTPDQREEGTGQLLDALGRSLEGASSPTSA
jgi:uncharacterized protein YndB with AHSA1/START domain